MFKKKQKTLSLEQELTRAIISKNLESVSYILKLGAYVNFQGINKNTPLHHTVSLDGSLEILNLLISHKADINIKNQHGWTPLHQAIIYTNNKALETLLTIGVCDVNAKTQINSTPLHSALTRNNTKAAELLIKYKADINAQDLLGYTPIHCAILNNRDDLSTVKLLVTNHADLMPLNLGQDNPVDMIMKSEKYREIDKRELLLTALQVKGFNGLVLQALGQNTKLLKELKQIILEYLQIDTDKKATDELAQIYKEYFVHINACDAEKASLALSNYLDIDTNAEEVCSKYILTATLIDPYDIEVVGNTSN